MKRVPRLNLKGTGSSERFFLEANFPGWSTNPSPGPHVPPQKQGFNSRPYLRDSNGVFISPDHKEPRLFLGGVRGPGGGVGWSSRSVSVGRFSPPVFGGYVSWGSTWRMGSQDGRK